MSNVKTLVERLPSVFRQIDDNKWSQLLSVIQKQFDELEAVDQQVRDSRDIDKAFGKSLEYLGGNLRMYRAGRDDDEYKMLVKLKIASLRGSNINNFIEIIATALNLDVSEVFLIREKQYNPYGEPASLFLSIPPEKFDELGFDYEEMMRFFEEITSAGVMLKSLFRTYKTTSVKTEFVYGLSTPLAIRSDKKQIAEISVDRKRIICALEGLSGLSVIKECSKSEKNSSNIVMLKNEIEVSRTEYVGYSRHMICSENTTYRRVGA